MALTKIDDRGLKTPIDLLDNEKIRFGTGSDLEIYHNGSDSFVRDQGTGGLYLTGSVVGIRNSSANENGLLFTENGATELYYDNSMKVQTLSNGVRIEGDLKMNYADNHKIQLGAASDLQIYHDGTDSRIHNSTGNLTIKSDNILGLYTNTGTEAMAKFNANGAVELYYDNSKKFHTNAGGCQVFGNLFNGDSTHHYFGDGNDLDIYHNGNHSYQQNTTGWLFIESNNLGLRSKDSQEYFISCVKDAAVKLYYNNSVKFETINTGAAVTGSLGIGTTSPSRLLHISGSGANCRAQISNTNGGTGSLYVDDSDDVHVVSSANPGNLIFDTVGTERARIDSSGNVGLGLTPQCTTGNILNLDDEYFIGFGNGGSGRPDFQIGTTGGAQLDFRCGFGSDTVDAYITTGGHLVVNENISIATANSNSKLVINGASAANVLSLRNTTGGNGHVGILFSTQDHSGGREKAAIYHHETHGQAHYGGDLVVCLNTAQGGATQVSLSDRKATFKKDGGLCFGTDTAYANALDDYEEGTFTPLMGGTNYGTHSVTGTGKYTKIGRAVHVEWKFSNEDLNNDAVGAMRIRNWPFAFTAGNDHRPITSSFMCHNVHFPHSGDRNIYCLYGDSNGVAMNGMRSNDGTGWTSWDISNFEDGTMYFEGTFTYMAS